MMWRVRNWTVIVLSLPFRLVYAIWDLLVDANTHADNLRERNTDYWRR